MGAAGRPDLCDKQYQATAAAYLDALNEAGCTTV